MPTTFPLTVPHAPTGLVNQAALDTAFTTPINDLAAGTINATFASYTAALQAVTTNPTLGTGSIALGRYMQIGKLVIAPIQISFGSSGTNAGSGLYSITLPVAAALPAIGTVMLGSGKLVCAGVGHLAAAVIDSGGNMRLRCEGSGNTPLSNTVPGAWTANDSIHLIFIYEAA